MIKSILTTTLAIVGLTMSLGMSPCQAAESSSFHYGGVVVDETTKPMEGVKVTVIGTDRVTKTDVKGAYDITGNLPAGGAKIAEFPLLEISANGYEPSIIRCDSLSATGSTVMIWPLLNPKAGDRVDIARWLYIYRKGYAGNPPETRWLTPDFQPDNSMLCGLASETPRVMTSIELEFKGTITDVKKLTASYSKTGNWVLLDTPDIVNRLKMGWQWQSPIFGEFISTPPELRSQMITFKIGQNTSKVAIRYSGADKDIDRYAIHVYEGRWQKPLDIDIEWGFQEGGNQQRWDGYIEAYLGGHVTDIQTLSGTNVAMTGIQCWQDNPNGAGRRGIQARIWSNSEHNHNGVTLWTSGGNVTFRPSDLKKGPILIPSAGIFIAKRDSGLTAAQFQKQLADSGKKSIRQRVREHREMNWAKAMKATYPDKTLPPIPQVPIDKLPGMLIDVPEKQLNDQWRHSAANIAPTVKNKDGHYLADFGFGGAVLASESYMVIRALDLVGLPHLAEGSLDLWLQSTKAVEPKGNLCQRDSYATIHLEGQGVIQATAGFHYRITRNDAWVAKVLPELLASHEYTQQLRKDWSGQFPRSSLNYGLLPPVALSGDISRPRLGYRLNASFYWGMREVASLVALTDLDRGRIIQQEADEYREAIRRSLDRSTAMYPVIMVQDGTYRRYMPFGPYQRETGISGYDEILGNGVFLVRPGVYAPDEAIVQDTLDVLEDKVLLCEKTVEAHGTFEVRKGKSDEPWFDMSGYSCQPGHEPQSWVHLLAGDAPLAIRAIYTAYASEILPHNKYHFQEHPFTVGWKGQQNKKNEEAAFLERVRMMLVQEEGDNLWLSRFSLREWFEQGKKISVTNSPTFFGPVEYEIISDVDNGKINATVKMPSRNPPQEVRLSLRHPKSAPIKSVTVNGKEWKDFNKDKEYIIIKGLTGTVAVTAQY